MAQRHSKTKRLGIWMNGQHVGHWIMSPSGESQLQYDAHWLKHEQARPLSLSLPFRVGNEPTHGTVVENYFDNLLPDSHQIRRRLAQHYRTPSTNTFDLLAQIGRDCVGAVQLLPNDELPQNIEQIDGQTLSEANVAERLRQASNQASGFMTQDGPAEDLRLSIAGMQEKTALLWHEGQWVLPKGSTPTTHIMKLPLGHVGRDRRLDMTTSVENEWLCLRILSAFGLEVPRAAILQFEDQKALTVERFDRQLDTSGQCWLRLPQEDFCQVTATPSHLKYESDGGPGIETICQWLQNSDQSKKDVTHFLTAQMLFWMLAATDGHAKNFSIKLLQGGHYHSTPVYDVLSAWPVIGKTASKVAWQKVKLAMAVKGKNRHNKLVDIRASHFIAMGKRAGMGDAMVSVIQNLITKTPDVIQSISQGLPENYPRDVLNAICENLQQSAKRLASQN